MTPTEIEIVNAIIGFCKSMDDWPNDLSTLGYEPIGVELEVNVPMGIEDRTVVPDVVCSSKALAHTLLIEAKNRTENERQERVYAALQSSMLATQGVFATGVDEGVLRHDVALVSPSIHAPYLHRNVSALGISLPIVEADDSGFRSHAGKLGTNEIDDVFRVGIQIEASHVWPRRFVRFNRHSRPADIAPAVANRLQSFVIQGKQFTTREIAAHVVDHWDLCGTAERTVLASIVRDILTRSQTYLDDYLDRNVPADSWQSAISPPASVGQMEAVNRRIRDLRDHYARQPSLFSQ